MRVAIEGRLCAFCSEVLFWPLAGAVGSVTWAERVDGGIRAGVGILDTNCQDRGHDVLHSLSLLRNIKVRVGAADWEFTMNLTSNVNFLFP